MRAHILLLSAAGQVSSKIMDALQEEGFSLCSCVRNIQEAKQVLIENSIDLLIVNSPLENEDECCFVLKLLQRRTFPFGIIMLFDQRHPSADAYNIDRIMRMGTVLLKKPIDTCLFLQITRFMLSFQEKIQRLEHRAIKLEKKCRTTDWSAGPSCFSLRIATYRNKRPTTILKKRPWTAVQKNRYCQENYWYIWKQIILYYDLLAPRGGLLPSGAEHNPTGFMTMANRALKLAPALEADLLCLIVSLVP